VVEATARPRRHRSSATRVVDAQAVIALADTAMIQILNDVGTRVWNLIDGTRTVQEIVTAVRGQLEMEGYSSVSEGLDRDVEIFFDDLSAHGLITWSGAEK